jgi:hypothetical protein
MIHCIQRSDLVPFEHVSECGEDASQVCFGAAILPVQTCGTCVRHDHMCVHAQRCTPLPRFSQDCLRPVDALEELHMICRRQAFGPVACHVRFAFCGMTR